ncbi:nucleotide exchange factor GrpE [Planococcus sp. CAU13]|uniref:nucleotide exchange factor GrpE n=1 Tax=Planococcus sp. CAU13 TaxID=1541197 RepID=UPI0009DD7631|nr:nucleotide exchange factor GrpE [Planococcus sp. CAU13]
MSNEKKPLANEEETATVTEETPSSQQTEEVADFSAESVADEMDAAEMGADSDVKEDDEDEVAKLKEELEKEQNKYLRLLADFDNFKRRNQKDKEIQAKFRSQSLLTDLLPVLDNFERALAVEAKSEEAEALLKGVEMVQKSLLEAVKREGLEEVKAVGEHFDPNFHQAVMQEKDEQAEPGTVLQELQKGYTLKGRVLRPAMVKVNE